MDNYIDMIVEIPFSTNIKYEYDEKLKLLRCDRLLSTSMIYPGNYGFIPNTMGGDNDPIDILLVSNIKLTPGCVVNVKIIGLLETEDEKGKDEKIIAVFSEKIDKKTKLINDISDLPKTTLENIKHFFTHYKDNESDKWIKVNSFKNLDDTLQIIEKYKINS